MSVNLDNKTKPSNGNNNNAGTTQMAAAFAQSMGAESQAFAMPQNNNQWSLGSLSRLNNTPLSRTPEGEALTLAMAAFSKAALSVNEKEFKVEILPVDMANAMSVRISALIVTLQSPVISGVAFHTVLLDGSIERPTPVVQTINGRNIQVLRLASDYNDDRMLEEVRSILRAKFPGVELFNADASVLDRDLPISDEKCAKAFLANALNACAVELNDRTGNSPNINLAHETREFVVNLRRLWNMNEQTLDINNHPVRANVQFTMSVSPRDNTQQARSSDIAYVNGYMDLVWINQAETGINTYFNQQQQQPKFYRPRFVMTDMQCKKLNTISAQLLAILQVATLNENGAWARAFTNESHIAERDFGAVGLEVPTRNPDGTVSTKRIDTRSADFKMENLYRFISDTVENNLLFTMHVPECGPDTWINRVFADAAQGSPNATAALINGANMLTNNKFSEFFNDNVVCITEDNRIINGYYYDLKGRKCDIRDNDYLFTLNTSGEVDLGVIRRFSDTHYPTAPLDVRMSERMQIIKGILGESVVFTGYSTPVTISPAFISALVRGAAASGFSWQVQDSGQDITTMQRGYAQLDGRFNVGNNFNNASLNRNVGGGFNHGGSNTPAIFRF